MKLWYALNKNLNSQAGRFIFDNTLSSGVDEPPETVTPEAERTAAMEDTSLALDELRAQLEANEWTPEDLPLEDQLLFLVRIARNDSNIDAEEDDRSRTERWRDSLGSIADNFISTERAQAWQYNSDFSDAAYILDLITDDAKQRFMTDYPEDSRALFTDNLGAINGGNGYRADFYGDDYLSQQANFMNLLSAGEENHQYLQIGSEFYARTPQGYLGFYPESVVGNRARVGSGTEFTVYSAENLPQQEPNLSEVLVSVRESTSMFDQIDSPEEMERLEYNRSVNYHTAQSWKGLANRVMEAELPAEISFTQTLKTVFQEGGVFRRFLDADSALNNYTEGNQAESFSIPGFDQTAPGLSSTASPSDFRDGILAAVNVVKEYSTHEVGKFEDAIAAETNPQLREQMIQSLQSLSLAIPELFETIDGYTDAEMAAMDRMRNANLQILQDVSPENISPEELEAWVNEFDESFFDNISNPEGYSSEAFEAQLGLLVSRILGCSEEEGRAELENNPELKNALLARINTLRRRPGIDDMDAALEITRQQFYVQSTLETLRSVDPSLVENIDFDNVTPEDLNQIVASCERLQEQYRMRIINDEVLSAEEAALYDYLETAIPHLRNASIRIQNSDAARAEAQETERNALLANQDATELLDIETERGQDFHRTVDIYSQAIRLYRSENNGEMPSSSAADFTEITRRLESGEPPEQISRDLQSAFEEQRSLATFSGNSIAPSETFYERENYTSRLPSGMQVVGIHPSGQYILESPGTDETQYLQNPEDGTIIAEHLTGVPDEEDLRVPSEEWATAQALGAMTEGFVVKSAAELARDGETLGNTALVNFMRQYWGIRGGDTLPESELDKFKSLGEMMSDNHINLHTVLSQLNVLRWDETAAGNRALDVRQQFNEILEAAAAGNNAGFRSLLDLDNLPEDIPTEE